MRTVATALTFVAMIAQDSLVAQQAPPTPSPESKVMMQRLSELLEPVGVQVAAETMPPPAAMGTKELRVRWGRGNSPAAPAAQGVPVPGPPPPGSFSISSQRRYAETAPRQRVLEIEPGRLLVAAVDRNGRLRSWMVIIDPRIVRSEGPGPDGTLTGQTLVVEQTEFFLSVPDDPEIVECRFYEPVLNGNTYRLVSMGSLSVTR
ncbi:MAG TPA: hypothetical protein VMT78_08000 [Terriglobia bacterium]|nr:hypothetical protein [Terriglobia bacterium]